MANARNWQPLLGGSGGEQGAGAAEKDPFQLPLLQLIQQIPAQGDGTAATAGATGMNILHGVVENQCSAIRQSSPQWQMIPFSQFQKHFFTDLPQIPGNDQIKILRFSVHVLHMGLYGLKCSRGHCQV